MILKCVLIDDEPLAIQGLKEHIGKINFLEISAAFTSTLFPKVKEQAGSADLLLLDIKMPEVTGIDFLRSLENPPMTILTTAYSSYALESYDLSVIDYLVKPIPFERFLKATMKAKEYYELKRKAHTNKADFVFLKINGQQQKIFYDEILYIEAMQHFIIIHTPKRKLITYMTLGNVQKIIPADKFLRVHKSFIVSLSKVSSFTPERLQISQQIIPIARTGRKEVIKKLLAFTSTQLNQT